MRCRAGIWDFEPSVQTDEDPGMGAIERPTVFLPWQSFKSHNKPKRDLLHLMFRKQLLDRKDFLLVRDGYFPGSWESSWYLETLLPSQLQVSSQSPGWLSFAQRWYSNQWSNREMLLLLVENYTQYPALLVWNITNWGNFWRPQLELLNTETYKKDRSG